MSINVGSPISRFGERLSSEASSIKKSIKRNSSLFVPFCDLIGGFFHFSSNSSVLNKAPSVKKTFTSINNANVPGHLITAYNFFSLFSLTSKNIKERREAKKSGDATKILDANLGAVSLASRFLNVAEKIIDFVKPLFSPLTVIAKVAATVGKVCSALSVAFSFADIVQDGLHYHSTHKFLGELKRERHLAFMEAYFKKMQIAPAQSVDKLSSKELKNRVKILKTEMRSAKQDALLSDIVKVSNQAFINAVTQKMSEDPGVLSEHFNAQIRKKDTVKRATLCSKIFGSSHKLSANFKEKLSTLAVNGDSQKLSAAVKLLKRQVRGTERSHIGSIVLNSLGFVNSVLSLALAAIPLAAPVGMGISLALSGGSIIKHFVVQGQSKKFVNELEKVIS